MTKILARHEFETNVKASTYVVPAGEETTLHNHAEDELFVVVSGSGTLHLDGTPRSIESGDIVSLPAFSNHLIVASAKEDLKISNFYWYDMFGGKNKENSNRLQVSLPSYLTPNGKMHIGHLAGPILSADILTRFRKMQGDDARLLAGTIGYQTNVAVTAKELGKSYNETAIHYSDQVKSTFDLAQIDCDTFITLEEEKQFQTFGRDLAKTLVDSGHATLKNQETPFCSDCDTFLFEAHVKSTCPHCGTQDVIGECETCGIFISDQNLIEPECVECGGSCTTKKLKRYFIPLEDHREIFEGIFAHLPLAMRQHLASVKDKDLPEIPLSIIANDGIQLEGLFKEGSQGQVLYSAIELAPRFLFALDKIDCLNEEMDLSVFFGSDNIYLRSVIFPIILNILYPKIRPTLFAMNYFYQLNGSKFSTSRKNVRYLDELLAETGVHSDFVRAYLAYSRPDKAPTEFVESDIGFINSEVSRALSNLDLGLNALPKTEGFEPGGWSDVALALLSDTELLASFAIKAYDGPDIQFRALFERIVQLTEKMRVSLPHLVGQPDNNHRTNVFLIRYLSSVVLSALAPVAPSLTTQVATREDLTLRLQNFNRWVQSDA